MAKDVFSFLQMTKLKETSRNIGKSKRSGCLITAVLLFFIIVSGIYFLTAEVRVAKRLEQVLIDKFGPADLYTPPIDGVIPAQRLEAFIGVREAVQPNCLAIQSTLSSIIDFENLETDPELSASDATSMGMDSFKSMFSAGPRMLEFSETRNSALLAENMGLGEYMHIYLTAYGVQLAGESESLYSAMEEAYISPRTRKEYAEILSKQLAALEAASPQPTYPELAVQLRLEIDALNSGAQLSPWPNGPVDSARESLAPYQQKISNLYCTGIASIELLQKNRGLQFGN
ncbi:MAG: hypothetical protein ACI9H8_001672 [Lysobacterales bacterium]|jgi:hypothetical protein